MTEQVLIGETYQDDIVVTVILDYQEFLKTSFDLLRHDKALKAKNR